MKDSLVGLLMAGAFVLINTDLGSEKNVLKSLRRMDFVEEAYVLYGVYGIVARIKAGTVDELRDILANQLRRLVKVRSTLTLLALDGKPTGPNQRVVA